MGLGILAIAAKVLQGKKIIGLFDLILKSVAGGDYSIIQAALNVLVSKTKRGKIIPKELASAINTKPNIQTMLRIFLKSPNVFAEALSEMDAKELHLFNEALSSARAKSLKTTNPRLKKATFSEEENNAQIKAFRDAQIGQGTYKEAEAKLSNRASEEQALSSSWLVWAKFYFISNTTGFITIETKEGRTYFFGEQPMSYTTWELMKAAQGRNGSGAGSVFHRLYWDDLKGKSPSAEEVATIFALAGISPKSRFKHDEIAEAIKQAQKGAARKGQRTLRQLRETRKPAGAQRIRKPRAETLAKIKTTPSTPEEKAKMEAFAARVFDLNEKPRTTRKTRKTR